MPKEIFLPPLDSRWRLLEDFSIAPLGFIASWRNDELKDNFGIKHSLHDWGGYTGDALSDAERGDYWKWRDEQYVKGDARLVAGTVLQFERYHVSHSGDDQITLLIVESPDDRINPRKKGGSAKGKGRIYLTLADVNKLGPVEEVTP